MRQLLIVSGTLGGGTALVFIAAALVGTMFPTGAVKVIFQDASYNPTKHNGTVDRLSWHWDNISVSTSTSAASLNVVPASFAPSGHDPLQLYCQI